MQKININIQLMSCAMHMHGLCTGPHRQQALQLLKTHLKVTPIIHMRAATNYRHVGWKVAFNKTSKLPSTSQPTASLWPTSVSPLGQIWSHCTSTP